MTWLSITTAQKRPSAWFSPLGVEGLASRGNPGGTELEGEPSLDWNGPRANLPKQLGTTVELQRGGSQERGCGWTQSQLRTLNQPGALACLTSRMPVEIPMETPWEPQASPACGRHFAEHALPVLLHLEQKLL